MDTLIIKACLNGARGRDKNTNVPWTPTEVAAEAERCAAAGAAIVHIHARGEHGEVSYDPAWYAEADALIRARTDLIINHTTARLPDADIGLVLRYLADTPLPVDMVSLNLGAILINGARVNDTRGTLAIPNSYEDIRQTIAACAARGIVPEPALFDAGFLSHLVMLEDDGLLTRPRWLLLEFGGRWGDGLLVMPGTTRSFSYMRDCLRDLYPQIAVAAHGYEDSVFHIGALAIAGGDHLRVGFEDRVTLPDGRLARSNAEFVEWAVTVGQAHGRRPATPAEARALIGLPDRSATR